MEWSCRQLYQWWLMKSERGIQLSRAFLWCISVINTFGLGTLDMFCFYSIWHCFRSAMFSCRSSRHCGIIQPLFGCLSVNKKWHLYMQTSSRGLIIIWSIFFNIVLWLISGFVWHLICCFYMCFRMHFRLHTSFGYG